jgi:hypothetical protein
MECWITEGRKINRDYTAQQSTKKPQCTAMAKKGLLGTSMTVGDLRRSIF